MIHSLACRLTLTAHFNRLPAWLRRLAIHYSHPRFTVLSWWEDLLCGSRLHFLLWLVPSWRRGWDL